MPPKSKSLEKFKRVKKKRSEEIYFSQQLIKKHSFAELEKLIKQAKKGGHKEQTKKLRSLYRQKLNAWSSAWQAGRQKLLANQQKRRQKKQAQTQARQAKVQAKQQKKQRLSEIYDHFRSQLTKLERKEKSTSPYFTPHLDLPPHLAKGLKKLQKEHPDYDPWREFGSKYTTYRLNKAGATYLLKQTNQAYQEELTSQNNQIRYWQEKAGLTKIRLNTLLKKGQTIKLFFPEKGEHQQFFSKKKEFKELWQKILTLEPPDAGRQRVSELSKELYLKSPWRLRDRFLIPTNQPTRSFGIDELWNKYYRDNPFSASRPYYFKALTQWQNSLEKDGEEVPEKEVELDRYGNPRLKEGQWMTIDSKKPGRSWTIYKNIPSWQEQVKKKVHERTQEQYILNEGSELEIQTWRLKKDKALCWVEASGLGSCSANQGTSAWWCLFCIAWGPYHPPVLPKHCPWLYTYKTWLCGAKQHSDANKQWHFSVEGERIRDAIKGGDWGSCHIGTFDKKKLKKQKRK